jgi:hypothetical protein
MSNAIKPIVPGQPIQRKQPAKLSKLARLLAKVKGLFKWN